MRSGLTAAPILFAIIAGSMLGQSGRVRLPVRDSVRLQLTADVDKASARQGVPVFIRLRLVNVSSKTVTVGDSSGYVDYELAVADSSGKEPQRTEFGLSLAQLPILRSTTLDLEPGQETQMTLELTKVYALPPGKYFARADRKSISETAEDARVFEEKAFSNPVEFTVVP